MIIDKTKKVASAFAIYYYMIRKASNYKKLKEKYHENSNNFNIVADAPIRIISISHYMTEQTIYTLLAACSGFISAVFFVLALPLHHKQKWWPCQKRTGVTTKNMPTQPFLNQHNMQLARYCLLFHSAFKFRLF